MKIITYKDDGWCAFDDDSYDGADDAPNRNHIGRGKSEQDAISALIEIMLDNDDMYDLSEIETAKKMLSN